MSGKKVILIATIFVSVMATFSIVIIMSASGDNVNNIPAPQMINKKNLSKAIINVEGMTCEDCEKTINTITGREKGVATVKASYVQKTAIVEYDKTQTDVKKIMDSIGSTGYKVLGYEDASGTHSVKDAKTAPHKVETMKCGAGKCGASGKCGSK